MIRGKTRNAPAGPARRAARRAARALAGAAVAGLAGLAACLAGAGVPALAAQHPGGAAASPTRPASGQHPATGQMSPGAPWAHIAAGFAHNCGIRTGGTLWCWGYGFFGQLGTGGTTGQDLPRQVITPAAGGWASVTAGGDHTCATRTGGTLWCWGANGVGQLGIGGTTGQDLPRQVITPAAGGWASVTVGYDQTCATRTGGTLWCWGGNFYGQLGIGGTTGQDLPRQVITPAAGGWASVTPGFIQTCAIRTDGTLWCWGFNAYGQLGIGGTTGQDLPRQVTTPAARGWASVTPGFDHTCATRTGGTRTGGTRTGGTRTGGTRTGGTRTGGTLWCWGDNPYGQLGTGGNSQDRPRQVTTPAARGWASVTAGYEHTCATRTGGTLWCWGGNGVGQLGIGSYTGQDLPRQVTTPAARGWASVTAGYEHTCATRTGGTLWCWGGNGVGQLGIGSYAGQDLPRQVTGCAQPAARAWPASPSHRSTSRPGRPHPATPGPAPSHKRGGKDAHRGAGRSSGWGGVTSPFRGPSDPLLTPGTTPENNDSQESDFRHAGQAAATPRIGQSRRMVRVMPAITAMASIQPAAMIT